MVYALAVIFLICVIGFAVWFPRVATVAWILVLETSPDEWLAGLIGGHETIVGVIKAAGLGLAVICALRFGARRDRYNPGFAFAWMFAGGVVHGLFPGLSLASSLRSLAGSAGPFAFGFARLPGNLCRAVVQATIWGPVFTVGFGALLAALSLHRMYAVELGALRLGASGDPPFLGGFALIGIYAGLLEHLRRVRGMNSTMLLVNFIILLLTGARAPLAIAVVVSGLVLLLQRRLMVLAGLGLLACLSLMFAANLHFIRVIDMVDLGDGSNLSNRNLVWPIFERAVATSPWLGWGVGAGKFIVPLKTGVGALIGTNAAHNEYLRIGAEGGGIGAVMLLALLALWVVRGSRGLPRAQCYLMRVIFIAFAVHSFTDNTLIATTSSVLFIWTSAVFATAAEGVKAPA